MRSLVYQVAVGKPRPLYERCLQSSADYCARHNIDHIVLREPILRIRPKASKRSREAVERLGYLPIYEKENAFAYLGEYDAVASIDADVYLRPSAPNIFDQLEAHPAFAGVVERDAPITGRYRAKLRGYTKGQYERLSKEADFRWNESGAEFFNMGVMVFTSAALPFLQGQSPRDFLSRPEFERFVNGEGQWRWSTDQTLLNYWIKHSEMPVQRLEWRWNALFGGVQPAQIRNAHFVHFFLGDYLPGKGNSIDQIIDRIEAGETTFPGVKGRG